MVACTRSDTLLLLRLCAATSAPDPLALLAKACSTGWGLALALSAMHKSIGSENHHEYFT